MRKEKAKASVDSSSNPVQVLKELRKKSTKLKSERNHLEKEVRALCRNNEMLIDMLELLERAVSKLREKSRRKYVYSFEDGGWMEKYGMKKTKMRLVEKGVSIKKINEQLEEIVRLSKRYKRMEKNI